MIEDFLKILEEGGKVEVVRVSSEYFASKRYYYRLYDKNGKQIPKFNKRYFNKIEKKKKKMEHSLSFYKLKGVTIDNINTNDYIDNFIKNYRKITNEDL